MSSDLAGRTLTIIADDDALFRRLHEHFVKADGSVSSAAFKTNSRPDTRISTDLARLTTPRESVNRAGRGGFQLGELTARGPRDLGFEVTHDPLPGNVSHTIIQGENTRQLCKELAKLVHVIPGIRSKDQKSHP